MLLFIPIPAKVTPYLSSHRIQRRRRKLKSPRSSITVGSGGDDAFTKYSGYLFQNGALSEALLLTEYNLPVIAGIYRRKPLLVLRRFTQISITFGRWFAQRYLDSINDRSDEMFKTRAAELRMILLELGPAFVKIAQAVSSRPDVIPPAYLEELSLLQDRIAPFSTEDAFRIIEKELGMPVDMLFSEITPKPIAAASLGQVYQARLRANGKIIAVKVQRPGVQAAVSLDIYILRYLAGIARRVGKLNTDLQALLDEWASSLFRVSVLRMEGCFCNFQLWNLGDRQSHLMQEMDYRAEARNGKKFRELYGGLKDVLVPEMYSDLTSQRVLTMEWVEGERLSEVKDLYLVEVGVYCSLSQLLDYGFYHADPHPGNLLRSSDGKLAYLDFGMMGEFKQELRDGFVEACLHLVNRDFDGLAKDFVTLGLLPPTAQKDEVTKALTGVFQNAVNRGVRNISFGDLSGNLGVTMYKFKFRIPSYFSLVIRSLSVLEGIAIGFDPNYKVLSSSYPWIARKVLTDSSPKLRSTLHTLLYKDGVFQIDRLESLVTESLRARTEETLDRQQAGESDDSRTIKQLLSFMLTEKGAFVRELLLQEIAKGIDALSVATVESVTLTAALRLPFFIPRPSSTTLGQEDITNLRTLRRLLVILSTLQKPRSEVQQLKDSYAEETTINSAEEVSLVLNEMTSPPDLLPIVSVIPELPSESQEQLLRLPVDLAGRLLSRAVARTIRRLFI